MASPPGGKAIGHVGPVVVLLLAAGSVLWGPERLTPLAGAEFAVGFTYLALLARSWWRARHKARHREQVGWLDLAAASLLALESYRAGHRYYAAGPEGGSNWFLALAWFYMAAAAVFVVLAVRVRRFEGRWYLHLHTEGFAVRTGFLGRARHLRWAELTAVVPAGPTDVLVRRTNGRTHRISFANVHAGAAHRDRLLAHARATVPRLTSRA